MYLNHQMTLKLWKMHILNFKKDYHIPSKLCFQITNATHDNVVKIETESCWIQENFLNNVLEDISKTQATIKYIACVKKWLTKRLWKLMKHLKN